MKEKIIAQGAESKIILQGNKIIKDRTKKSYRINEIDEKLRIKRTKSEINLLNKASKLINAPIPIEDKTQKNNTIITMPYIKGKKLSEYLDKLSNKESENACKQIGNNIAILHDNNIIHGDLTTSNMILDEKGKIWFIDFGLGFISERIEDKAVDLHLINQALEAKHFKNYMNFWKIIQESYLKNSKQGKETLQKLKIVESRGRYKDKY